MIKYLVKITYKYEKTGDTVVRDIGVLTAFSKIEALAKLYDLAKSQIDVMRSAGFEFEVDLEEIEDNDYKILVKYLD